MDAWIIVMVNVWSCNSYISTCKCKWYTACACYYKGRQSPFFFINFPWLCIFPCILRMYIFVITRAHVYKCNCMYMSLPKKAYIWYVSIRWYMFIVHSNTYIQLYNEVTNLRKSSSFSLLRIKFSSHRSLFFLSSLVYHSSCVSSFRSNSSSLAFRFSLLPLRSLFNSFAISQYFIVSKIEWKSTYQTPEIPNIVETFCKIPIYLQYLLSVMFYFLANKTCILTYARLLSQ